MRLDPILDAVYALGAFWGGAIGPQVCSASPDDAPRAAFVAAPFPRPRVPAGVTAFVDVNVVPMDTERVLPHQTVLVAGGKITALGPSNTVKIPAGAVRIDGRGKYLMPGLTDMHVHGSTTDLTQGNYPKLAPMLFNFLASGVTAIRVHGPVAGGPQALKQSPVLSPYVYMLAFMTRDGKGEIVGVHDGWQAPLERADSVGAYLAAAKAAGYDHIRLSAGEVAARKTLPVVDSLLVAAQRLGLPVMEHDHPKTWETLQALGSVGGSVEHLFTFWSELLDTLAGIPSDQVRRPPAARSSALLEMFGDGVQYFDTLGPREMAMVAAKLPVLAAAVKRSGLWLTPTFICIEASYVSPGPRSKPPLFAPLSPSGLVILRQMLKALQDTGVGLLLSGDDGRSVHDELAAFVRAGLTPYQALRTGTYNVAQYFGQLAEVGTVAVGKRADLVLLSGNPLQDIRHTWEPAGVMTRGRWLDRAALDQGLLTLFAQDPEHKSWLRFRLVKQSSLVPWPSGEQVEQFEGRVAAFEALSDSLAGAQPNSSEAERIRGLLAAELGAMRARLVPGQEVAFDGLARVWLREQARQGHPVTIPGITVP